MTEKPRLRRVRMLARPRTALNPFAVDLLWLAHRAACGLCAVAFGWMVMHGERVWMTGAVLFGVAAGAILFEFDARLRAQRELVLRDRLELIGRRLRATADELVIRGTPAPILPGFLIVVWFLLYAPAAASGLSAFGHLIGLLIFPLLLLLWMRGARWLFPPVLVLSRHGLTTRAFGRVPWQDVSHVQLVRSTIRYAPDLHSLVVTLVGKEPRPHLSWWQRYVRGAEAGKTTVPLRNATEDRLLILHLAEMLLRAANPPPVERAAVRPVSRFARQDAALLAAIHRVTAPAATEKQTLPAPSRRRPRERLWFPEGTATRPEPLTLRPGQQWLLVAVILACVSTAVFGQETDFFRSERWNRIVLYVALIPGLAASSALIVWLWPRVPERSRIGSAIVLTIFPLLLSWSAFASALPDLYTRLAGRPFRVEQTVTVLILRSECGNRLQSPILDNGPLRGYLCISPEFAASMARDGKAIFSGRESWFGRHVYAVEAVVMNQPVGPPES